MDWKTRALRDPQLSQKDANLVMNGPECLAEAWKLAALKIKYSFDNEFRTTTDRMED